jgi:UDP-N-acetyl-D-mannosaminuronic acid transferase (WecB/TagA/CpsF family)
VGERVQVDLESDSPGIHIVGRLPLVFEEIANEQDAKLVAKINAASPDIPWGAFGSARQEKWMASR